VFLLYRNVLTVTLDGELPYFLVPKKRFISKCVFLVNGKSICIGDFIYKIFDNNYGVIRILCLRSVGF
jgi:hypothetical protein